MMKGVQPGLQPRAPFPRRQAGIIGKIVAPPHEGVDRTKGLALGFGEDEKSVVEISSGRARNAAAHRIGHRQLRMRGHGLHGGGLHGGAHSNFPSAARATRTSLRDLEIEGLRPRTAYPSFSIAFRIS